MFEDTRPAALGPDDDLAEFRVTAPGEIRALLKQLMDDVVPLNLSASDGSAYTTTLWTLDPAAGRLSFTADMNTPAVLESEVANAERIGLVLSAKIISLQKALRAASADLPVDDLGKPAAVAAWLDHHLVLRSLFDSVFVVDGNLHLIVGKADTGHKGTVEAIVYGPLAARNGSVSAEHGIGLQKRAWLGYSRSPEEIALMRVLKQALDPRDTLNPGKILAPGLNVADTGA